MRMQIFFFCRWYDIYIYIRPGRKERKYYYIAEAKKILLLANEYVSEAEADDSGCGIGGVLVVDFGEGTKHMQRILTRFNDMQTSGDASKSTATHPRVLFCTLTCRLALPLPLQELPTLAFSRN